MQNDDSFQRFMARAVGGAVPRYAERVRELRNFRTSKAIERTWTSQRRAQASVAQRAAWLRRKARQHG